jgi:hypothetical protein
LGDAKSAVARPKKRYYESAKKASLSLLRVIVEFSEATLFSQPL